MSKSDEEELALSCAHIPDSQEGAVDLTRWGRKPGSTHRISSGGDRKPTVRRNRQLDVVDRLYVSTEYDLERTMGHMWDSSCGVTHHVTGQ
eukprot:1351607-Amorphochlora_amoeboformis.AAC.1